MFSSTLILSRMLSTLVFFSMLIPASNSLKCFSCYSKDSCYTENILIKVGWIVLKPQQKGLEQADNPAGTDEWYCKRGSRLLLALYTPPTLALSLEAACDDMLRKTIKNITSKRIISSFSIHSSLAITRGRDIFHLGQAMQLILQLSTWEIMRDGHICKMTKRSLPDLSMRYETWIIRTFDILKWYCLSKYTFVEI